ncbi:MAG: GMP synthase (glutamine-hydrolyzing) [Candidatus Omnitrophota bacterium]|nr:MAG: GMP synthase (glutamine-hydrolyzing) [Candidatus Omnitrophota bacterium]
MKEYVIIIDFGSQYSQLIARRLREACVYSEVRSPKICAEELKELAPSGIILSGGPASLTYQHAPKCDPEIFKLGKPILGICYGMQLIADYFKGKVSKSTLREYGRAELFIDNHKDLFFGMDKQIITWMSHEDKVNKLPLGFEQIAHTKNSKIAAFANKELKIYGVQFHPEVAHTPKGKQILKNFLFRICKCRGLWNMRSFIKSAVSEIKESVRNGKVVCGLSGGVDSSVCAVLLNHAIGSNAHPIFVDNGLLRYNEVEQIQKIFSKHFQIKILYLNQRKLFLEKLKNIVNPESKRKIIGREFIRVFDAEAKKIKNVEFLAQGTLYPDVIESCSVFGGPSAVIKSHHNVGGLPKKMRLKLIEPLKYLFKDEVRALGRELGIPESIVGRHPFPGPGLAIRIIGSITEKKLKILRSADRIFIDEIQQAGLYKEIWQAFAVLLPVKSVGVMGDERTYECTIALRAVTSIDGMTADWARMPSEILAKISNRIINEIKGVNRVVYDISSKPPSTIEWE